MGCYVAMYELRRVARIIVKRGEEKKAPAVWHREGRTLRYFEGKTQDE